VEVLIRVSMADQRHRQADLYVAAADGEAAEAAAEAVLPPDKLTVTWRLPAGRRYTIRCCGLDGWCRSALDLTGSGERRAEVACDLEPLGGLTVTLRDKMGTPVAGAEVGAIWALAPPTSATSVSAAFARRTFSTTTDENGAATLSLPQAEVSLLAELPGRGLGLVSALPTNQAQLVPITFHAGGSLEVVIDGAGTVGESHVWLRPDGKRKEKGSLYRAFPLSFWRRRLIDGRASWPALQAGDYVAFLDGDELARAGLSPQPLGSATVTAAGATNREWKWPGIGHTAVAGREAFTTLELADPVPTASRLYLVWPLQRRWRQVPYTVSEEGGRTLLRAPAAPPETSWTISTPGSIAAPVGAAVGSSSKFARMSPAGRLAGTLVLEGKIAMPRQLLAHFSALDGGTDFLVPAEIEASGTFEIPAPVGRFRVTLEAPGAAAEPITECLVRAGRVLPVAPVVFRREAEVLTRVVDATASTALAGVLVRAVPARPAANTLPEAGGPSQYPACVSDGNGWCRIGGLLTGEYHLQACHPGYACAAGEAFKTGEGTLVETEDLRLSRAATLRVAITGDLPALTQVWVLPAQAGPLSSSANHFISVEAGQAVVTGIQPGTSTVEVVALRPDGLGVRLAQTQVCLAAGEDRLLQFGLGTLKFHGRLTDHEVGVPGRLVFHPVGDPGSDSFLLLSEADDQGRFSVNLPTEGRFTVEVEALGETIQVEVEATAGEELHVALPGGAVQGRVVDTSGRAVSGADVVASGATTGENPRFAERHAITDGEGKYRFDFLDPLDFEVTAMKGELKSQVLRTPVGENTIELPRLVVRDLETVTGYIVDETGRRLAGAQVSVIVSQAAGTGSLESRELIADGNGRFQVPAEAESLNLVVSSPGHGLRAFRVEPVEGFVLAVPSGGGAIRLEGPSAGELAEYLVLVSADDGGFLFPLTIGTSAGAEAYVLPNLGTGTWIALRGPAGNNPGLLQSLLRGAIAGWQVLARSIPVTREGTTRLRAQQDGLIPEP